MKISYEIYNDMPYLVNADMSDTAELVVFVTRGEGISVRFNGDEKRLIRNHASFDARKAKDGIHRLTLFTRSGMHELIPIKISAGVGSLYHADALIAELYRMAMQEREQIDALKAQLSKINAAVFGSNII